MVLPLLLVCSQILYGLGDIVKVKIGVKLRLWPRLLQHWIATRIGILSSQWGEDEGEGEGEG